MSSHENIFPNNSFQIPFGIRTLAPYPVDYWSGPFTGDSYTAAAATANALIPSGVRFISMGVRLIVEDEPKMYWYYGGTADTDLVPFIEGTIGGTGNQGFQGHTGFQGFQGVTGPAGSGKYFYGPTAPEDTAEGLTLGSKWFNTEVGGEFTYLSDPNNLPYWVMTNVFSATGPQGPLGGGTGNQGFQGHTGPTGFQGFQGVPGPTGVQGVAGPTGFQGFQGNTGPTGFQGFQGHTGFQGFQGVAGPTGVQGFQGTTGAQGPLGLYPWIFVETPDPDISLFQAYTYSGILFKAESGINIKGSVGDIDDQGNITGPILTFTKNDYFYGPTAPDESDGLTIGVKWFNTEVGGEFTYLSDPGNQPYWVMTNVFSATGPQGPLGGGTGNQGFQGHTGFQGFQGHTGPTGVQGFQGVAGPTGVQGFQGVAGPTGFQGFQGHTGVQGLQGVAGPTGFQGFQGVAGPTGFQGFQGHTGVQGFQGVAGPTGVQGFQGHTGFQGFQGVTGPAGSGKYFYSPTAPENTAEGLTLGSKWFNTEVGGEFTYLSDPNNQPYWVMTNVFSATGPQGPLGGGTGNQGFQGHTGFQGFRGTTGVKGETGDGLFDTSYATGTNVNNSINYNNIGNVTGTGRKFPVLLDDGSLTFDFIRTTDLFNNFTISSFILNGSSLALIGTGSFSLDGRTFNVSYTPDIIEVSSASIDVDTTNSGYPLSLSSPYTSVSANGTSIDYPASKNTTILFTITATASDGSSDTATDTITFRQYNYWGIGSETGITVGNLSNLSNEELLSNRTKTFTVSPSSGEYIYYGYPENYGDATFRVDGTIGGFQKITISGGETHTNSNGYDEKYRIYRSDFANLGNTTVEVT